MKKFDPSLYFITDSTNYSEEEFLYRVEEALKGGAADVTGHISIAGVYAFIDKALGPWEQRPIFKTNVTRFTSLREVKPQVDITVLRKIATYFETEDFKYELNLLTKEKKFIK